jgi:hypothetical protein
MAKKFPVVQDDAYDEMAATYQLLEIARLDEILKRSRIPSKTRRTICEAYFFAAGAFLDSGWLTAEGERVFPTLCFADRPVDPDEGLGEITRLHIPSAGFAFHEYAGGAFFAYFDDRAGSVDDLEHGCL